MDHRQSNKRGTYLVVVLMAIAVIAATVGVWKRGLRPVSPDALRGATTKSL
jgi:hypothetical protein